MLLPWEPGVAWCLADLEPGARTAPPPPTRAAPSAAPSRGFEELGYAPIVGPELEFFLCERDPAAPGGIRRRVDRLSMVYTVGPQADPERLRAQDHRAAGRAWASGPSPPTTSS